MSSWRIASFISQFLMKFKIIRKKVGSLAMKKVGTEAEPGKGLTFSMLVSRLLVFFHVNMLTLNLLPPTSKMMLDCMSVKMSSNRSFLLSSKKSSSKDDNGEIAQPHFISFLELLFFSPQSNLVWVLVT